MSVTRILVLGSSGMLGHKVKDYLINESDYKVYDTSRGKNKDKYSLFCDIYDSQKLNELIKEIRPDILVNCIGVLIKGSQDIKNATYVNAKFPHYLKKIALRYNFKLIHISTDCVFSGTIGKYKENDKRDGFGTYAETKKFGEIIDDSNLTLRTSIVGPELKPDGEGLFNWFMSQENDVNGYLNSIWSGVSTLELSKSIKWAIDADVNGLYHITNNSSISKFELLRLFKKYTKKNIGIMPFDNERIDKSLLDTRNLIDYEIPSYEQIVKDLVCDLKKNIKKYPHYQKFID